MGKGSLNVALTVLCTEAERAAIVVSQHAHAHGQLASLGYPAADAPRRLASLAARGRDAHTEAGRTQLRLDLLLEEGREVAADLYDLHKRARRTLRLAELHDDAAIRAEAHAVRMALTLQGARLRAGLEGARFLRDTFGRPGSPLTAIPGILTLRGQASTLAGHARDLVVRTQDTHAERSQRTRERTQAYEALRAELRHLRDAWAAARAMSADLPKLRFELVRLATTDEGSP